MLDQMIKSRVSKVLWLLGVAVISASLVACGTRQRGRTLSDNRQFNPNLVGNNGFNSGCAGCLNEPELITRATGESFIGQMNLDLEFWGDYSTGHNFNDPQIVQFYSGPVTASGVLNVGSQDTPFCPIPIGQYDIVPISAGNMSNTNVLGVEFEGLNRQTGDRFYGRIEGQIYSNNLFLGFDTTSPAPSNQVSQLSVSLIIEELNGVQCDIFNSSFFFTSSI